MAFHVPLYPSAASEPFVRGDPATFVLRISIDGVDQDVTAWTWRCHVRAGFDDVEPVTVCTDFDVVAPDDLLDIFEAGGATPCVLLARFTGAQTARWRAGMVSDLEQLTPVKRTWAIFDELAVDRDVSHTEALQ